MEKDNGLTYSFDVCSQCRSICCQDAKPPLTEKRKKIVKNYLEQQKMPVKQPFSTREYSYPTVDKDLYCCLFNKQTGKCMVHPVKPETCVSGPVTFNINFSTRKVEWFLKTKELCQYAETLYNDKAAFSEHFDVAKKQIMALIDQLSADELRAIMDIEEPQTFKFSENDLPKKIIKKLGL